MKPKILKNFIVLEGLDGSGTSTQCSMLADKIPSSHKTFEPTDSDIGKLIRKALQKKIKYNPDTLSYLFAADRSNHLYGEVGIINKCKDNIVVCDRYLFSSLAYQSLDIPFNMVYELNREFPIPQIVFFLNTSASVCQKRINKRGNNKELFEDDALQKKILNNYLKSFDIYKKQGLKLYTLNGNLTKEEILSEELRILEKERILRK
jgi:dTMP kinase